MKNLIIVFALAANWLNVQAQDELKPANDAVGSIGSIFGGDDQVTKVRLIASAERSLTVSVEFKGFKDKKYKLRGNILNGAKKPLKEVPTVEVDLPANGNSADLTFKFQPSKTAAVPTVMSKYLAVSIVEAESALSDLDKALGGTVSLSGSDFMYHLEKQWRAGGSESMVVTVKLTPFKSAASIKQ